MAVGYNAKADDAAAPKSSSTANGNNQSQPSQANNAPNQEPFNPTDLYRLIATLRARFVMSSIIVYMITDVMLHGPVHPESDLSPDRMLVVLLQLYYM